MKGSNPVEPGKIVAVLILAGLASPDLFFLCSKASLKLLRYRFSSILCLVMDQEDGPHVN